MKKIMKKHSTTFYSCMEGWPTETKEDIYKLYAYLRVCDEIVEGNDIYDTETKVQITNEFHDLSDKYQFKEEWLNEFHHAMITDLHKKEHNVTSMLEYCKGSAEAVGCMMASILGCPPEAEKYARALGRAYQIINFVRDYEEDKKAGYQYITENHQFYLNLFFNFLEEGMAGVEHIPLDLRQPIYKASEMYMRVADELS